MSPPANGQMAADRLEARRTNEEAALNSSLPSYIFSYCDNRATIGWCQTCFEHHP